MSESLYFEDLHIGQQWTSPARTITETDVVNFAGLTGDYDPLHVDHEFARQTPFGRPIAHGLLGLSWVAGLSSHSPSVRTMAFVSIENWEFLKPAYIGDTVHVVTEVADARPNGRRTGHVKWRRQLINQAGEVIQSGVLNTLVAMSQPVRQRRDSPDSPMPNLDTSSDAGGSSGRGLRSGDTSDPIILASRIDAAE